MKNYLAYFKTVAVEIQFGIFGFFFLRLDKQLESAVPAFKNSLKKTAGFDLFVQRKDCSLIPLELLDLILLQVELMKNPRAGGIRKPRDVHPLVPPPLLKTVVEQRTQLLHPFMKHGSRTLCQKAAQQWKSHCI